MDVSAMLQQKLNDVQTTLDMSIRVLDVTLGAGDGADVMQWCCAVAILSASVVHLSA